MGEAKIIENVSKSYSYKIRGWFFCFVSKKKLKLVYQDLVDSFIFLAC